MIRDEWKSLFHNKLLLLVVLVIALIPTIYAGLFLASLWDPYGNVDQLPVAVVNEDRAVDYNGRKVDVGDQMEETLRNNSSLAFRFVDAETAKEGLKKGTYYMVITIPEDFSANATTLLDETPKKMELKCETNPGTNYIASKMSASALAKIKANINQEVTSVYAQTVFDQIGNIGNGMQTAAVGAGTLEDGVKTAADGNQTITLNLNKLADSSLTFTDGANTFAVGLQSYTGGIEELHANSGTLNEGTGQVSGGLAQMSAAVNTGTAEQPSLVAGAGQLESGLQGLHAQLGTGSALTDANGNPTLLGGMKSGVAGMETAATGMTNASAGISGASSAITQAGGIITQTKAGLEALPTTLKNGVAGYDKIIGGMADDANGKIQTANGNINAANRKVSNASSNMTAAQTKLAALQTKAANGEPITSAELAEVSALLNTSDLTPVATVAEVDKKTYTDRSAALTKQIADGLDESLKNLETASKGLGQIATGLTGPGGATEKLNAGATEMSKGAESMSAGAAKMETGMETLQAGVTALYAGSQKVNAGVGSVGENLEKLSAGSETLQQGVSDYTGGVDKLYAYNHSLTSGAGQLTDGASQIRNGAAQLADGSTTLGDGLAKIGAGTSTLKASLQDGAVEVQSVNATPATIDLFAAPVAESESKLWDVQNNGHAMAPYMMSVGLWVGALAFCLMYPLTRYRGKLKSGFAWWASKASILYPLAILMGALLIFLLGVIDGFAPAELGKTVLFSCLAALTFTAIMYFFNVLLGKVGSFLMLVFMVVQLAGSAGTYPVELSPAFVSRIHRYVPFTYSVDAFRSTICGGESILPQVIVMVALFAVFTALTILEFGYRAKRIKAGKRTFMDFLEEHGLA